MKSIKKRFKQASAKLILASMSHLESSFDRKSIDDGIRVSKQESEKIYDVKTEHFIPLPSLISFSLATALQSFSPMLVIKFLLPMLLTQELFTLGGKVNLQKSDILQMPLSLFCTGVMWSVSGSCLCLMASIILFAIEIMNNRKKFNLLTIALIAPIIILGAGLYYGIIVARLYFLYIANSFGLILSMYRYFRKPQLTLIERSQPMESGPIINLKVVSDINTSYSPQGPAVQQPNPPSVSIHRRPPESQSYEIEVIYPSGNDTVKVANRLEFLNAIDKANGLAIYIMAKFPEESDLLEFVQNPQNKELVKQLKQKNSKDFVYEGSTLFAFEKNPANAKLLEKLEILKKAYSIDEMLKFEWNKLQPNQCDPNFIKAALKIRPGCYRKRSDKVYVYDKDIVKISDAVNSSHILSECVDFDKSDKEPDKELIEEIKKCYKFNGDLAELSKQLKATKVYTPIQRELIIYAICKENKEISPVERLVEGVLDTSGKAIESASSFAIQIAPSRIVTKCTNFQTSRPMSSDFVTCIILVTGALAVNQYVPKYVGPFAYNKLLNSFKSISEEEKAILSAVAAGSPLPLLLSIPDIKDYFGPEFENAVLIGRPLEEIITMFDKGKFIKIFASFVPEHTLLQELFIQLVNFILRADHMNMSLLDHGNPMLLMSKRKSDFVDIYNNLNMQTAILASIQMMFMLHYHANSQMGTTMSFAGIFSILMIFSQIIHYMQHATSKSKSFGTNESVDVGQLNRSPLIRGVQSAGIMLINKERSAYQSARELSIRDVAIIVDERVPALTVLAFIAMSQAYIYVDIPSYVPYVNTMDLCGLGLTFAIEDKNRVHQLLLMYNMLSKWLVIQMIMMLVDRGRSAYQSVRELSIQDIPVIINDGIDKLQMPIGAVYERAPALTVLALIAMSQVHIYFKIPPYVPYVSAMHLCGVGLTFAIADKNRAHDLLLMHNMLSEWPVMQITILIHAFIYQALQFIKLPALLAELYFDEDTTTSSDKPEWIRPKAFRRVVDYVGNAVPALQWVTVFISSKIQSFEDKFNQSEDIIDADTKTSPDKSEWIRFKALKTVVDHVGDAVPALQGVAVLISSKVQILEDKFKQQILPTDIRNIAHVLKNTKFVSTSCAYSLTLGSTVVASGANLDLGMNKTMYFAIILFIVSFFMLVNRVAADDLKRAADEKKDQRNILKEKMKAEALSFLQMPLVKTVLSVLSIGK